MNNDIRNLAPNALWNHFADLNAVPRPSKKEERVIKFMLEFGKKLGLETKQDAVGNVVIVKPATVGMEDRKTIVMQSHLDMVHQKNNDTVFDFDTQGIQMKIVEDWVKAEGTTLGADNGLGVATIMAILSSKEINHPKIEALFTIDEETGMTGALSLSEDLLTGEILLNLDTEEDDELCIGCAGGVDFTAERTYKEVALEEGSIGFRVTVKGLEGGHSGMDIIKGLGNANKIMNRLLFEGYENFGLRVASVVGGSLRNAIPRESVAEVSVEKIHREGFLSEINQLVALIKNEQKRTDPNLEVLFEEIKTPEKVMDLGVQIGVLKSIYAAHNGVYRMSPEIPELVESSNNIAKIVIGNGTLKIDCLTRSSVDSSKDSLVAALRSAFELSGCEVATGGEYPGWEPKSDSEIVTVVANAYESLHGEKPHVMAVHAGLECGIIGQHYPNMDMVSFGPTIKGAHSPDERVSISSVQKYWKLVLKTLENTPKT